MRRESRLGVGKGTVSVEGTDAEHDILKYDREARGRLCHPREAASLLEEDATRDAWTLVNGRHSHGLGRVAEDYRSRGRRVLRAQPTNGSPMKVNLTQE